MRKLLVSLSIIALSAGVASAGAPGLPAADPVITAPAPVIHPRAYDWTGGYAGLGLSYGRSSYRADTTEEMDQFGFEGRDFWPSGSGWGIGGLAGFNWQSGNVVYGFEGHLSGHRMRGTTTFVDEDEDTLDVRSDVRSIASLRGRVGVAQDRTLLFVTAGPAVASVRHTAVDIGSESRSATGLMIGIGVEHALAGGWNIRGDLEHYRFRSRDFTTADGFFPGVRPRVNLARVSAVFRF
jgi:outer membrane immunogenic protein